MQFPHKYFKQVQTLLRNNQWRKQWNNRKSRQFFLLHHHNFFLQNYLQRMKFHTFPHALDRQLRCLYWKGFPHCHPKCLCLALSVMGSGNSLLPLCCATFSHRKSILLSSLYHAAPGNVHSNTDSKEKLQEQSLSI